MWWTVHRRTNKRNLRQNKCICNLGKDLEEILKGRLETIDEEPEAEEREWLGESRKPMLVKAKMKVEKGKAIVKAKVKSGKVFYMLCVIGLASKRGFNDLVLH
ncbi:Fasciclin-like arabinogalactan family protein [Raphanus sativus]|nr:Fasciclin-like arabinogalactan family protein [Raphanus sativus]